MKHRKIIGIGVLIIFALAGVAICGREVKKVEIPLFIKTNESKPTIQLGMNEAYIKPTTPIHSRISMTLDADTYKQQLDKAEMLSVSEAIDLIIDADTLTMTEIEQAIDKICSQTTAELYIYIQSNHSNTRKSVYRQLEVAKKEKVYLTYPVEDYGKVEEIEYVGIEIRAVEDLVVLEDVKAELAKKQDHTTQLILFDYIVEHNQDNIKQTFDLIYNLYYDAVVKYPEISAIMQQSNLGIVDPRISELYESLVAQTWLTREEKTYQVRPYEQFNPQKLAYVEEGIEVVVPYQDNVNYVEYKLNGQFIEQQFRYPYVFKYDIDELESTYNTLRVIIYEKNSDIKHAQDFYFEVPQKVSESAPVERPLRTGPTYDATHKMMYDYPYVPVLMYHEFADKVENTKSEQSITVGTALFEAQIQKLIQEGYTAITFKDLQDYFKGVGGLPEKPVIITTDDAYLSNYEIAYPILKRYHMPATYFVTSQYVGVDTQKPHFTWEHAREMEESGLIDIQSHTHSHFPMNSLPEGGVIYQTRHSFELIERYLGERDVRVLSYPQFLHSQDTVAWLAQEGVDIQVTDLCDKTSRKKPQTLPLDVKRIHVSNQTTPEKLIEEMVRLTMK